MFRIAFLALLLGTGIYFYRVPPDPNVTFPGTVGQSASIAHRGIAR